MLLRKLAVITKWAALALMLSFKLSIIVWILVSPQAMIWIVAAISFALLIASVFVESRIVKSLMPICKEPHKGLLNSLERVAYQKDFKKRLPRILILIDPAPQVLTVKSAWSSGTIIVSQGVFSALNEDDLRACLAECLKKIQSPESVISSVCTWINSAIYRLFPRGWSKLLIEGLSLSRQDLDLTGFVLFLIYYPWIRVLNWIGAPAKLTNQGGLVEVTRKLNDHQKIWSVHPVPIAEGLYFYYPKSTDPVLSLRSDYEPNQRST